MRVRPMLYSTPMVQSIMDDTKTMTRRTLKMDEYNPEILNDETLVAAFAKWKEPGANKLHGPDWHLHYPGDKEMIAWLGDCPYGEVGDLLWVRESFSYYEQDGVGYNYKADFKAPEYFKWKPSIHMPKIAARIWLQITNVRVERLQEISEQDAKAEGVERKAMSEVFKCRTLYKYKDYIFTKSELIPDAFNYLSPVNSFKSLWKLINGADSWGLNPWVWVISFKVLSKTGYKDISEEIRKQLEGTEVTV